MWSAPRAGVDWSEGGSRADSGTPASRRPPTASTASSLCITIHPHGCAARCSEDPAEQNAWGQRLLDDAANAGTLAIGCASLPYMLPHAAQGLPAVLALVFPSRPGGQFTSTVSGRPAAPCAHAAALKPPATL